MVNPEVTEPRTNLSGTLAAALAAAGAPEVSDGAEPDKPRRARRVE